MIKKLFELIFLIYFITFSYPSMSTYYSSTENSVGDFQNQNPVIFLRAPYPDPMVPPDPCCPKPI